MGNGSSTHCRGSTERMFCCVGDDKKRGAVLDFEDAGAVRTEKVATLDAAVNSQMRQEQQARARMFQQISDKDKQIENLNKSLKALNSQQVAPEKDSQVAELEAQVKQLRDLHQSQAKREQVSNQSKKSAAEAQRIAELETTVKVTAAAKAAVEADAAAKEQQIALLTAETVAVSVVKAQAAIEKAVLEKERQTAEQAVLARETQIAALELKLSTASETVAKKEAVQKEAVKKAANDALAKLEADLAVQARQKAAAEQEVTAKEAQIALLELQVLKKEDLESQLLVKVREKFQAENKAAANEKLMEEQMEARVAAQQAAEAKEARIQELQQQVAEMEQLEAELVKLATVRSDENNRIAELEAEVQAKVQAKVVLEASHLQKDQRIASLDSSIHKLEAELEAGKQAQAELDLDNLSALALQAENDKQGQMVSKLSAQVRDLEKEREARLLAEQQCAQKTELVEELEAQLQSAAAFMHTRSGSQEEGPRSPKSRGLLAKVFTIFDADGNHLMDENELLEVGMFVWGPEFDREVAHDMFVALDTDHDGMISIEEFVSPTEQTDQLTKALSGGQFDSAMKDEHIEQAMADARKQVLVKAQRHTERVDRMRDLFAGFDTNGDGRLSHTELYQIGMVLHADEDLAWTTQRNMALMDSMDKDRDGLIDVDEFLFYYKSVIYDVDDEQFELGLETFESVIEVEQL